MDTELVLTPGLGNATYLLASDGEAIVVDPPRDAWRVTAAADARGWRITHVVETHVHNDYLSGALELRDAVGAAIVAPARGRYAFPHRGVDDGDVLEVGGLRLTARATPGHTPEHLAWEVAHRRCTRTPTAVLTGGSLLVGSAGPDGPARATTPTEALTRAQFHSLQALARPARRGRRPADPRRAAASARPDRRMASGPRRSGWSAGTTRCSRRADEAAFRDGPARWSRAVSDLLRVDGRRSTARGRRSWAGRRCWPLLDPAAFAFGGRPPGRTRRRSAARRVRGRATSRAP